MKFFFSDTRNDGSPLRGILRVRDQLQIEQLVELTDAISRSPDRQFSLAFWRSSRCGCFFRATRGLTMAVIVRESLMVMKAWFTMAVIVGMSMMGVCSVFMRLLRQKSSPFPWIAKCLKISALPLETRYKTTRQRQGVKIWIDISHRSLLPS